MSIQRIAVVTGANRGLGLECSRQLAAQGVHVVLTSRDEDKGSAAVGQLSAEGLPVSFHPLDVTSVESAARLASFIEEQHGRLDILVNNAGVFLDNRGPEKSVFGVKPETVNRTFAANTTGALIVSQALVPLMRKHNYGRVVNVSSTLGQLSSMQGNYTAYRMSKAALNALTRVLAAELEMAGGDYKVNSMCPGWVATDMGGPSAPLTPEQGVDTMIWLATLGPDGPTGGFWFSRSHHEW